MTREQWRLSRRILDVLAGDVGLTDRQLAERLGVTAAELRPAVGMLIGQRRVDTCWTGTESYIVQPPQPIARERAA